MLETLASRRVAMVLATLLIALNGAYLLKNGDWFLWLLVGIVLTCVIAAVSATLYEQSRGDERETPVESNSGLAWKSFCNAMMLFALVSSVIGIFG